MKKIDERLIDHLGTQALGYLLGVKPDVAANNIVGCDPAKLSGAQRHILTQLTDHLRNINQTETDLLIVRSSWLDWLCAPTSHGTQAFRFHCQATGVKSGSRRWRTIEDCLKNLINDLFICLLLPENDEAPSGNLSHIYFTYLRYAEKRSFEELVLQDTELQQLFSHNDAHTGQWSYTVRNTGQASAAQLQMLAPNIVGTGWILTKFERSKVSEDRVLWNSLRCLDMIRQALRGDDARVPVRVGIAGISLPNEVDSIEICGALLRKTTEEDSYLWASLNLDPPATAIAPDGDEREIEYSLQGDLILELDVQYKLLLSGTEIDYSLFDKIPSAWNIVEELSEILRLGLILSQPSEMPLIATTWQRVLDPISPANGLIWQNPSSRKRLWSKRLKKNELESWVDWCAAISGNRIPSIGVAIRRMLMAVEERYRCEDELVDAVIVWENLFGAKSDTTLRIASALALLLSSEEESVDEKVARYKQYKKLYSTRSDVVHGAPSLRINLRNSAESAVQISIQALRAVFGEKSFLLKIESSEERSLALILGTEFTSLN